MLIHPVQAVFIEDNFKSIYFPILLKADGFLPPAFFLPLYSHTFKWVPAYLSREAGCFVSLLPLWGKAGKGVKKILI